MRKWGKRPGAGLTTVLGLVFLSMVVCKETAADARAAAAESVGNPDLVLIRSEVENGYLGGYAKVTFANPEKQAGPIVVELSRPIWSREWDPVPKGP